VSNDNPYAESIFRTCKYRPGYPNKGFKDLEAAPSMGSSIRPLVQLRAQTQWHKIRDTCSKAHRLGQADPREPQRVS